MGLALALGCAPAPGVAQTQADRDPALQQTVTADERVAPAGESAVISAGHADLGATFTGDELEFLVRDDSQTPPVWRHLSDVVFQVGDEALQTLPEGSDFDFTGAHGGDSVWVIPQTEVHGVPWLGWNTQSPALLQRATGGVNMEFGGHEGEGDFSLFLQPGGFRQPQQLWNSRLDGTQRMWVEANTHTHANWVFTKPGVHLIGVRAVVTDDAGQEHRAEEVVKVAIGGQETVGAAQAASFSGPWRGDEAQGLQSEGSTTTLIALAVAAGVVGVVVALAVVAARRANRVRRQAGGQL
ncbi:choice-of-anchor M domain-containing protein [Corynebacterium capitovis]|uniref:choice-of-anchor M domain-containing protein n=1 Tax=Corynebacterium capitovis TaxID=131081 RepID=UPI00037EA1A4|nr:choice-of-anchor M domain-containing protein [Corynebacterium capitovis]